MKVSKSQLSGWLKDPVTEAFIEATKRETDNLIQKCGRGGCLTFTEGVDKLYHFYQGQIETAEKFITPAEIIEANGLIIKEKDDEQTH